MIRRRHRAELSATDRHAAHVEALCVAVLESDAVTDRATRAAAARDMDVPGRLGAYLGLVREASYKVTDAHIHDLRRDGYPEEELFEVTVAAALGAGRYRLDAGLRAVRGDR